MICCGYADLIGLANIGLFTPQFLSTPTSSKLDLQKVHYLLDPPGQHYHKKFYIKSIAFSINVSFYKLIEVLKFHFEEESNNIFHETLDFSMCAPATVVICQTSGGKSYVLYKLFTKGEVLSKVSREMALTSQVVTSVCFRQLENSLLAQNDLDFLSNRRHVGKPLKFPQAHIWENSV